MAWMPAALKRALPENTSQPSIRPTQVILHVSAGESTTLYYLWMSEGLESHFYAPRVNQLEQYMDTTVEADANYLANRRPDGTGAISVETQGADADGLWGAKQQDDIVAVLAWAHKTHGIPLRLCTSPDDPGIGWHVMWGAPGAWTPAVGKVCPGPNRIKQIPGLIARAQAIVDGKEDLSIVDAATKDYFDQWFGVLKGKIETTYNQVNKKAGDLSNQTAGLAASLFDLPAAVSAAVVAAMPAQTDGTMWDSATLSAAVSKAVADEVAKRLAA